MSKYLYLTGGRQNIGTGSYETKRCNAGLLLRYELDTGIIERVIEYITPIEYKAEEDASVVFKAGHAENGKLYICTTTEVLIYDVATMELLHHITHPYFNDLHHVCPGKNNSVVVASTGLDAVFEISLDGDLLNEWSTLDTGVWDRFDKMKDYRKILSTKPHYAHPNYVFFIDEDLYCNRLIQRDAICLTNSSKEPFMYKIQSGHDGALRDEKVFFTTVDGHIIVFDAATKRQINIINLNEVIKDRHALGWCRGIEVLDDSRVIVGFSRLRPTKWKENISWVKHRLALSKSTPELPTRISCVNINNLSIEWTVNLEDNDLGEIFSILLVEA